MPSDPTRDMGGAGGLGPWYPVAASEDLEVGAPIRAVLLGQEMVLWRAEGAGGGIRARAARCPVGGAPLLEGAHVSGEALVCACHRVALKGYGEGDPETFPAAEGAGLIWAAPEPAPAFDVPEVLSGARWLSLSEQPVAAPPALCLKLSAGFTMARTPVARFETAGAYLHFRVGEEEMVLFVQPQEAGRSVLRAVRLGVHAPADAAEIAGIRARYGAALAAMAAAIEAAAAEGGAGL